MLTLIFGILSILLGILQLIRPQGSTLITRKFKYIFDQDVSVLLTFYLA
ncbi:hypothetical protein MTJW_09700 [Moorella thermoacetica]|nr:hypothetical protein MTJW_09700 [Moorella thermoacetica]